MPSPETPVDNRQSSAANAQRAHLGFLNATSINMSNMVGTGPFITLPLIIGAMGGPQALIGWFAGAAIAIADGLVWSELSAALPGSGGSYVYLRESFNRHTWGRLWAFLFVFQLVLSGPLEIASGNIAIAQYLGYLFPLNGLQSKLVAAAMGVLATALLYRRITSIARLMMALWLGMLLTVGWLIVSGLWNFDAARALDFPSGAFDFNRSFFLGLSSATLYVMYCYLGYYGVCYLGDEVREPARTIPKAMVVSILGVLLIDFLVSLGIIGVVPWREAATSQFVASEMMQRIYGSWAGIVMTLLIVWTAFASVYALILTYSRVPYAAAQDGNFFGLFARLHPSKDFPHYSLLLVGGLSVLASCFDLQEVIAALMTARILVQFLGQIVALEFLRRFHPEVKRPFRMWLYPLPSILAFAGWTGIFLSSGARYVIFGLATMGFGVAAYLLRARGKGDWPFSARALAFLLGATSVLSLMGCNTKPSAISLRQGSAITSTVISDGEIWFRHSQIQLRFDSEMYCRVFLYREGKLHSINDIPPVPDKAKPPQFITVSGDEVRDFQVDYRNIGVSELRTPLGEGKRMSLTGYAKTAKGVVIEKRVYVELYSDFPDVAIVWAVFRNSDRALSLEVTRTTCSFFRLDAARSNHKAASYDFWILQGDTDKVREASSVRVDARYSKTVQFDGGNPPDALPLIDLWTDRIGMAIGDLSVNPQGLVSTVTVAQDQKVEIELRQSNPTQLAPGQALATRKTVWMVHTGDSGVVLERYRMLLDTIGGKARGIQNEGHSATGSKESLAALPL